MSTPKVGFVSLGCPKALVDSERILTQLRTEAQLDRVGCFQYSPVEGAPANDLDLEPVPDEVKQERWERFMAHQQQIPAARLQAKIGREIEVLVDEITDEGPIGRSAADAPEIDGMVFLDTSGLESERELALGEIVRAKVTNADEYDLWAEVVN